MSDEKKKALIEEFNNNLDQLVEKFYRDMEKLGSIPCETLTLLADTLATVAGEVEGTHIELDARGSGVDKLDEKHVTEIAVTIQRNVAMSAMRGLEHILQTGGHFTLADLESKLLSSITPSGEGSGSTFH